MAQFYYPNQIWTRDCSDIYQIYTGGITISDDVMLTVGSDLNGASPRFTLTCISTGGPATTVTWTRDPGPVMGDEMSVLDTTTTATTAQYTHTLTVTGRLGGLYTCTVANDKPSEYSEQLNVQGLQSITQYPYFRSTSFDKA